MAVKDHSLDGKIERAARAEFMEKGYIKASLHKIAADAGITTGALYTRYKSKDDLFSSIVRESLEKVFEDGSRIDKMYYDAGEQKSIDSIIKAIRSEEEVYLDIMFRYYDECVLFMCRSQGSSVEKYIDGLIDKKVEETIKFLKKMTDKDIDFSGTELILYEQVNFFRLILEKGYSKEKAMRCIKTADAFMAAGWKDFFGRIM